MERNTRWQGHGPVYIESDADRDSEFGTVVPGVMAGECW
jgi:hypothetical protein